jgi:hypothetical protein
MEDYLYKLDLVELILDMNFTIDRLEEGYEFVAVVNTWCKNNMRGECIFRHDISDPSICYMNFQYESDMVAFKLRWWV